MAEILIHLEREPDGAVSGSIANVGDRRVHRVSAEEVAEVLANAARLMEGFESGQRPLADPVSLADLGRQLHATFLAPLDTGFGDAASDGGAHLRFSSADADCLNLPWELLPGGDGRFLVADVRVCFVIEQAIGSGGSKETVERGLAPMASALKLEENQVRAVLAESAEHFQRDRAAELVRQAFDQL